MTGRAEERDPGPPNRPGATPGKPREFRGLSDGLSMRPNPVLSPVLDKWYRCSVLWPWRFHAKMKMADEAIDQKDHNGDGDMVDKVWIDNGSVSDDTDDGWE